MHMHVHVHAFVCVCSHSLPSGGFNRVVYSFAFYMTLGHAALACLLCSDQMLKLEHRMDCRFSYYLAL